MKERTRQRLSRLARNSRTLNTLDYALYLLDHARSWRSNRRFGRRHPDFEVPPAALAFASLGTTSHEAYFRTGLAHARFIAAAARKYPGKSHLRVLEWGCGPGRIIRHLPGLLTNRAQSVVGVDLSAEMIDWCRRSIPGIEFLRNRLQPPLPFPDGLFDFVYAVSVFTHLDEASWRDWMRELRRVLTEGGALLFTTHGKNYLPKLLPDEADLFSTGQPVFRDKVAQGKKRFVAYHPRDFVLGSLPDGLRVRFHTDSANVPGLRQDVWVVTKDSAMATVDDKLIPVQTLAIGEELSSDFVRRVGDEHRPMPALKDEQ